ncbi:Fur family ferric uptake transcriptional regulator [Neomicrococcus aestuarii]|uniref:Fur family ferric uptake transcriptional regulator n=1 Tax=Neomicrococcus aestuarii TaxID=556325 RepID=A0A7W8TVY1_9MICC|nr:Fur family transcriptional regulator [Neomicrococcus aestuarii]MBB5513894.1 Fur family ferric uptake transcriptional regulator [Neomicrococcus aestuarii]
MSTEQAPTEPTSATNAAENRSVPVRNTRQRRSVEAALGEVPDFMSAQELFVWLQNRGEKVSLATVYRILQSMADEGTVDVVRTQEGESIFRQCHMDEHHHHLLCRGCGKTVEIEAPHVEEWAASIAAKHGFTQATHVVEISGLCAECSARARAR